MKRKILVAALALMLMLAQTAFAGGWSHIIIAEDAILRADGGEFAATLTMGAQQFDAMAMVELMLGADYIHEERGEYDSSEEFRSAHGKEPWEYKHAYIEDDDGSFRYYDPAVHSERGAEYQPPCMNMLPSESMVMARVLLEGVVDPAWLSAPSAAMAANNRWSYTADRWMTDDEYRRWHSERDAHYVTFTHLSDEGIAIHEDRVYAMVGVDGLALVELNWHEWTPSEQRISPMPLEQAITMANSTREADTVLYYADLVYSNWVSEGAHNLCWHLITSNGTYFVDCVLERHMCDSYEY